eukprot:8903692-Pyramimonas_sp.AAC.1
MSRESSSYRRYGCARIVRRRGVRGGRRASLTNACSTWTAEECPRTNSRVAWPRASAVTGPACVQWRALQCTL